MRILILGSSYSAKRFFEVFSENKENIVFSTISDLKNYIEFKNSKDIVEFCEANEINLVLITDEDYINQGVGELITSKNISAFCPSIEAVAIVDSKSYAKKFMHRQGILTPKFQIADNLKTALDYVKSASLPLAIKPDSHSFRECTLFCETFSAAQKVVNDFFASGNKKIVIEDYIEGKNISVWALSDGYSAKIIGSSAKYQNNVALFNPPFLDDDLKKNIQKKIINPTINFLSSQGEEYIGILGFDCILTKNREVYLLGYNSFFDDINADFFIEGFDLNWAEVFDSAIVGDVFLKYNFDILPDFMLTLRQKDEIIHLKAKTKSNLDLYLNELNLDLSEYYEGRKIWKY